MLFITLEMRWSVGFCTSHEPFLHSFNSSHYILLVKMGNRRLSKYWLKLFMWIQIVWLR